MSIVVRYHPKSLTVAKYEETHRKLEEAGLFPAAALDYHVCFGSDGDLLVSEIWDSREEFEAFGERLGPLLAEAGIEMSGEPDVFEIHDSFKR
jgi:hypothetical protein